MLGGKKRKTEEDEVKAFLGSGTEFNGKLVFNGSVRVDGNFKGDILGGGILISGEGSRIEGNIIVDNIMINGDVCGNLEVREKVEIYSHGKLFGDMVAATLVVQEGAVFEGTCRMSPRENAAVVERVAMQEEE